MRHDRWGVHMVDIRIGSRINLFGQKIQISVCSKEFGLKNCSKNFWVKNIFDFKKKWVNKWKAGMKWPIPLRRNEIVDSILVGMKLFIPFWQEKGAAMSKLVDY